MKSKPKAKHSIRLCQMCKSIISPAEQYEEDGRDSVYYTVCRVCGDRNVRFAYNFTGTGN